MELITLQLQQGYINKDPVEILVMILHIHRQPETIWGNGIQICERHTGEREDSAKVIGGKFLYIISAFLRGKRAQENMHSVCSTLDTVDQGGKECTK